MALPQFVSRSFHFVFSQLFGNYVFPPLSSFITVTTVSLYDCYKRLVASDFHCVSAFWVVSSPRQESNSARFVVQNVPNCRSKRALLPFKTCPFAIQFGTYCKPIRHVLQADVFYFRFLSKKSASLSHGMRFFDSPLPSNFVNPPS